MTVFSKLESIYIRFSEHPTMERAHVHFNQQYAGELTDLKVLFTDDGSAVHDNALTAINP